MSRNELRQSRIQISVNKLWLKGLIKVSHEICTSIFGLRFWRIHFVVGALLAQIVLILLKLLE